LSQVQERPNPQPPSLQGKGANFKPLSAKKSYPLPSPCRRGLGRGGERFSREVKTVPHTSENRYNWDTGELVRFFNPRRDVWGEHFELDEAVIQPLTDIGEVTARILEFNNSDRLVERQALIAVDRYSSPPAQQRMTK